jgi:inner membrane transporter RhtA
VLLFARVDLLAVAWLRIASAAAVFAVWRRPWRSFARLDGLALAMLFAAVVVTPIGGWQVAGVLGDPIALLAGLGVGVSSSVIPYVTDQLAMARLPRATYALFVALLPATATVVGIAVLRQIPSWPDVAGVLLVMVGVAVHRPSGEPSGARGRKGRTPEPAYPAA